MSSATALKEISQDASEPLVSIIVPTYNGSKWVAETINSLLSQSWQNIQLVIVDDCSTDDTVATIEAIDDPRIVLVSTDTNSGIGPARNRALREATGKYVAFCDHDDLWLPEKLSRQIRFLEDNPDLGMAYSDVYYMLDEERTEQTLFEERPPKRGAVFDVLLESNFIPNMTTVARRDCIQDIGDFTSDNMLSEDLDYWLRFAAKYSIDYVDAPLAYHRRHANNQSASLSLKSLLRKKRTLDKFRSRMDLPKRIQLNGKIAYQLFYRVVATLKRKLFSGKDPVI